MANEHLASMQRATLISGERADAVFDERYKGNLLFAASTDDQPPVDYRVYEFEVDANDRKSRRDFARFRMVASILAYTESSTTVILPGIDSKSFIQVYLKRSIALDNGR